jgi:TrmH family RNA methyltransferase
LRQRKSRERERLFVVEGIRSVAEALDAGADICFAVVAPRAAQLEEGEALCSRLESAGVEVARVTNEELEVLSDSETPQGVLLVCREPERELAQLAGGAGRTGREQSALRILILDGLQDPGNAGTLVRAAAAFGLTAVVALDGTVDLYNAKAVRASAGGVFRVPLLHETWEETSDWLQRHQVGILIAEPDGLDVAALRPPSSWALVVGGEARGVRPAVAVHGRGIGIPMPGGTESLNAAVAGSILLYDLTRDRSPQG